MLNHNINIVILNKYTVGMDENTDICFEPIKKHLYSLIECAIPDYDNNIKCYIEADAFNQPPEIVSKCYKTLCNSEYNTVVLGDKNKPILSFTRNENLDSNVLYLNYHTSNICYIDIVENYIKDVLCSFMNKGVKFISFSGIVISPYAKLGSGTIIHPNTEIRAGVEIGQNCEIGPCSVIENSKIGNNCIINATQVYQSIFEDNVKIGPYCHVRPNTYLCSGVKIGDFVEVKNSKIGHDTHASHLTYIGDSDVGDRVNFGCGVVTVNYDGDKKARTTICDDAFVGCNTNLVAPVTLEKGAYTAAGSTITKDVPADSLGIARAKQVNYEGWVPKKKAMYKK